MMGLGYALWEGLLFEERKITNGSFADYKIPTARDIPTAIPIIVEKNYAAEPYGAKGVGEMSVFGIAPAIGQRGRPRGRRPHQRFADVRRESARPNQTIKEIGNPWSVRPSDTNRS